MLSTRFDAVQYAAFFDLLEDSNFDILLVNNEDSKLKIKAVYNNIDRSSFFLKARMISDQDVGTPIRDASFRCVLTDVNEGKFIAVAGSAGQTAYGSLQIPFGHIGVGLTNNFIE